MQSVIVLDFLVLKLKSVQSTLNQLIMTSAPDAMFIHFLMKH